MSAVLVLVMYYLDDTANRDLERRRAARVQLAIALAIKHEAIGGVPRIQFVQSAESGYPVEFYTVVRVADKNYLIVTDENAQVLARVDELPQ
jgi:hypothetical protein